MNVQGLMTRRITWSLKNLFKTHALSRKSMLLTHLDIQVPGLESLRDLYANDTDFSMPFAKCSAVKAWEKYHMHDGY